MDKAKVAAVHVWFDNQIAPRYWSVSSVDEDGGEVTCYDGSPVLRTAWEIGVKHAERLGVPCVEMDALSREIYRWDPPASEEE